MHLNQKSEYMLVILRFLHRKYVIFRQHLPLQTKKLKREVCSHYIIRTSHWWKSGVVVYFSVSLPLKSAFIAANIWLLLLTTLILKMSITLFSKLYILNQYLMFCTSFFLKSVPQVIHKIVIMSYQVLKLNINNIILVFCTIFRED